VGWTERCCALVLAILLRAEEAPCLSRRELWVVQHSARPVLGPRAFDPRSFRAGTLLTFLAIQPALLLLCLWESVRRLVGLGPVFSRLAKVVEEVCHAVLPIRVKPLFWHAEGRICVFAKPEGGSSEIDLNRAKRIGPPVFDWG
jgi:hypothetical protein